MIVQKIFQRAVKATVASAFLATTMLSGTAHAGPTLDKINQRGTIKVGVGTTPGFFAPDSDGKWQGFFIDFGRALSIAVFGTPDKVEFTSSSPQQRLPALQSGEFDVLLSGVTVTATRAWNSVPAGYQQAAWEEAWTQNGPLLDTVVFVTGLPDGKSLVKQRKKDDAQVAVFRADMTPNDLVSMIETSYRVGGITVFEPSSRGEQLVAEERIRDYAEGQDVELALGSSSQVFALCERPGLVDPGENSARWVPMRVTLTNANRNPARVRIVLGASGDWQFRGIRDTRVEDGETIVEVTVPGNGRRVVSWEVRQPGTV